MDNLKRALEITKISRKAYGKILNHYSLKQLNFVPNGFKNNLFWNIAHVVVTQQLLVCRLSGLDIIVSEEWVELFKKGSSTQRDATEKELEQLKTLLLTTIETTEKAIDDKLFGNYTTYMTSTGYELKNSQDAFDFNNFHEGIHLGYVLALKKAITSK